MKKYFYYPVAFILLLSIFQSCKSTVEEESRSRNFDTGWLFLKDSIQGAELPGYNDSGWRKVDLPHDWSIEDLPNQSDSVIGPFSIESAGGMSTGYFVGGTGWYRKHFTLSEEQKNKIIWINFDGVYMDCDIWLNGRHLGSHPYGYTPFNIDLTKYLNPVGEDNILAVRVRGELCVWVR